MRRRRFIQAVGAGAAAVATAPMVVTSEEKSKAIEVGLQNPSLLVREMNNRSLHHFLRWAWPILNSQDFVDNWHIRYLCQELEKVAYTVGERKPKLNDLLINIPPGSTKTMLCTIIFPVWCWTKWHWMRFITASYSGSLALESAESSRDLIKSDGFKDVYPDLIIKTDKDAKTNYRIAKRKKDHKGRWTNRYDLGGYRYSTSVGGTLTGYHGDIIIWDDPLNPQQAASEKELENANRWIDHTLPTRKTNKEASTIIGIMQRLAEHDPTGHILKKEKKNTKHICLPGEIIGYGAIVKPRGLKKYYVNDLFDPKRLPLNVLKELETDMGQYGYAGQIGQSPAPLGGGMFKVVNLQETTEVFERKDIRGTVRFWDKAATAGGGAYTAGVKISRLKSGKFVIENVIRGQWSTEQRERIIRNTAENDGRNVTVLIEQEPGSGGKESAENTIRNLAGFTVYADRPTGDKTFRADPFSVQVNNGNVMMRQGAWNLDFSNELELFPNVKFKDQTDAASGAFNFLTRKKDVKRIT
jgi:predicted phage terminase large subunit-like protein